ncbi:mechanosensitive ion channel domain-containing protein [Pseudaeromonas sharmana]|uniref:Small-conductance mechanosensitive channel n=1 Tax=Pseudaeromonas sharmana TaxID=328412 RepID=A0ABV8CLN7_9GAMM
MEPEILTDATHWLSNNQALIIEYSVNIAAALLTLLLGWFAASLVTGGLVRLMKSRNLDVTITDFVGHLVKYAILAFVVIAALSRIGVQTASFVAVIGAAGLAVGLALQGSLSNFAAGVLLILFRPLKAGEFVEVAGTAGVVQTVQIFTTVLTSGDNKMVVVPNGAILNGTITNYSRMETRRVDMTFGIAYGADLQQAKAVLERLLAADERILKEPAWTIAVAALNSSSVDLVVRPWVKTADYWGVFFDLQERVKLAFDEAGIEIPFPQMKVHQAQ